MNIMTNPKEQKTGVISCPNCGEFIKREHDQCPYCSVSLGIAAVIAEKKVSTGSLEREMPITPEILVPRLGEYLVENGKLNLDQLDQALEYQKEQSDLGRNLLLGDSLMELGLVEKEYLDQAVTEQILSLQEALRKYNTQLERIVLERTSELQTALDKLTELNSLKNNFISNISHELRTPLAHMIGYIDLLSDESLGPLTAEQMTAMDVLVKAANRLQKLIDNLLQFSIASQGYMQLDIKPVSVQLIIKSAISKNVGRADDAEVALKVDAPIDPIHVLADGEKIIWVLEQLVDNGIKFNHPGGSVLVSAKIESGVRVNFSVVDSGIGIPEKRIEEIFEEFHQLDGSTTRRYGGTGLGLSLAKRILDAHDVELKVSSKDADGTRFEFALPAVKKQT
jgi:signal transduction histidine kinase